MHKTVNRFRTAVVLALALVLTIAALPAAAERGDDTDRASKNGKAMGTVDGVDVTLEYGRPQVKERQIWGGLVPFDKVWRTGADEATTITFSGDVEVEGQSLAAGTYALFTIPGKEQWTVIFNTQAEQWGAYDYDESKDALRVMVTPEKHDMTEALDFAVQEDAVVLMWDEAAVPFSVSAD